MDWSTYGPCRAKHLRKDTPSAPVRIGAPGTISDVARLRIGRRHGISLGVCEADGTGLCFASFLFISTLVSESGMTRSLAHRHQAPASIPAVATLASVEIVTLSETVT